MTKKSVITRKTVSHLLFWAASLLAFLGMANIFSLQGYLVLASSLLLLVCVLIKGKLKIRMCFCLLMFFGIFYNFFSYLNGVWDIRQIVYFIISPASLYFFIVEDFYDTKLKNTMVYIISFSLGMFLSALSSVFSTFLFYGFSLSGGQPIVLVFENFTIVSRTSLSLYLMPVSTLCLFFLMFSHPTHSSFFKWCLFFYSIFAVIASFVFSNKIGNRAFIVLFAVVFVALIVFKIFSIKNEIVKIVLFFFILILSLAIFCLVLGVVPSFLADIPVFSRFLSGGSNQARLKLYQEFFSHFYLKPFGGTFEYITDTYVHNFWLDIYNFTGVIPFVLFSYLFVASFRFFVHEYRCRVLSKAKKVIFCSMISIFAIGLLEPIFQANSFTYFFFVFFFSAFSKDISYKSINSIRLRI